MSQNQLKGPIKESTIKLISSGVTLSKCRPEPSLSDDVWLVSELYQFGGVADGIGGIILERL